MRMIYIGICMMVGGTIFLSLGNNAFARGNSQSLGFNVFYKKLKNAVKDNDRKTLVYLMADDFIWGVNEVVSKGEALRNMDQFKLWAVFKRAVDTKLDEFVDSDCPQGCFAVWDKKRNVGFVFKKIGGIWKWSELRGD